MTLADLLQKAFGISLSEANKVANKTVTGVAQDSRKVAPGYIFVARSGLKEDGHIFAEQAVSQGAVAVIGERQSTELYGVPYIHVDNAKAETAKLAAAFYGYPAKALFNIGITGTDGKTTTSFILHYLLKQHFKTGLMSTAALILQEQELTPEGHFTTPEAPEVQALLANFRDSTCSHAVLETSSHGFSQHRLDEITYDIGIWTNLSPEHLDFHETLEAYREAKLTLMHRSNLSILNKDDPHYQHFANASQSVISYGLSNGADWQATYINVSPEGQTFNLQHNHLDSPEVFEVSLPMIGRYNVYNAVAALIAAHQTGIAMPKLIESLKHFPGVPGRMQVIQNEPFKVIVDFAHTPAALEKALDTLRPVTKGKLIVVIGAAGERDPVKRPILGKLTQTHADIGIFTEEDSRSENIVTILIDMANGAIQAGGNATKTYWTIPDRSKAIKLALHLAEANDTVLLAGKGHERTLERDWETIPWNEVEVAKEILAELNQRD